MIVRNNPIIYSKMMKSEKIAESKKFSIPINMITSTLSYLASKLSLSRQISVFMYWEFSARKDSIKGKLTCYSTVWYSTIFYGLLVYGAAEPELTIVQNFLDRCYKQKYISERTNICVLLEKQDRKMMNNHPLYPLLPRIKKTKYNLRKNQSLYLKVNTDEFKYT